jgi:hypothetical protein
MMCIRRIAAEVKKSRQVLALPDGNRIHTQLTHRVFIREEMPLYTNTPTGVQELSICMDVGSSTSKQIP